jgi:geranylgeranyl reductase family protein
MEQAFDFDVIVVGGGPAGASAALRLGQGGARVLLLEKAAGFPREKPCGGGLTGRLLKRLPQVREMIDAGEISCNRVTRMHIESPDGTRATYQHPEPLLYLIRRWEFDAALFRRAGEVCTVETGVTIRRCMVKPDRAELPGHVELEDTTGKLWTAPLVIAADSANSVIARQTGLRTEAAHREYAVDMMEETSYERLQVTDPEAVTLCLTMKDAFGYGYVFPKTDRLNLGFGCKLDWFLDKQRGRGKEMHEAWVERCKQRGDVTGETDRAGYKAFPIPISGPLERTVTDRVMLAGDAGGFVNAFSAEGIYYAMVSGWLAGEAALEAIREQRYSERSLARYERLWKAEIGDDLAHAVDIQGRLFNGSDRIDSLVRNAARDPELLRLLVGYSTGLASYEALRNHMVRSAVPKWVWGRMKAAVGF